jgi:hypothetical protein
VTSIGMAVISTLGILIACWIAAIVAVAIREGICRCRFGHQWGPWIQRLILSQEIRHCLRWQCGAQQIRRRR